MLDRALAIFGAFATICGVAVTWYSLKSDPSTALLAASGWAAALLIGVALTIVAIRMVHLLEKEHERVLKLELDLKSEIYRAQKCESISEVLASMISGQNGGIPRAKQKAQSKEEVADE